MQKPSIPNKQLLDNYLAISININNTCRLSIHAHIIFLHTYVIYTCNPHSTWDLLAYTRSLLFNESFSSVVFCINELGIRLNQRRKKSHPPGGDPLREGRVQQSKGYEYLICICNVLFLQVDGQYKRIIMLLFTLLYV